jgi:hypothetical protein
MRREAHNRSSIVRVITFDRLWPDKGIPYHRNTVTRKCKAKEFPQPIWLSSARKAWDEDEIDRWLAERAAARDRTST